MLYWLPWCCLTSHHNLRCSSNYYPFSIVNFFVSSSYTFSPVFLMFQKCIMVMFSHSYFTLKNQVICWEYPLEQEMATHSSILAWKIHGQRSPVGYSPWGCKESDTTEHSLWNDLYLSSYWHYHLTRSVTKSPCVPFN